MIDDISVRFILAVLVLVVGLLFLFGLYRFGTTLFGNKTSDLFSELREFVRHFEMDKYSYQWWTESL